jgi:hypothetical protein
MVVTYEWRAFNSICVRCINFGKQARARESPTAGDTDVVSGVTDNPQLPYKTLIQNPI